jgi:transcriptional regulator with XRE-family HTH domain
MKRTKEHQDEILKRIKLVIKEKGLTQIQLAELTGINQGNIGKYLNGVNPLADGFIYTLICKLYINPIWLENGEGCVYLSPSIATEIKNSDTEDVKMSREVFNVIADQAATIRSQQDIIHNYIEENNECKSFKTCIG